MNKKKKILSLILFLILLNAGAILWLLFFRSKEVDLPKIDIEKKDNQKNEESFSYGKIISLSENEIEYLIIESNGKLLPEDQRINKKVFYDDQTNFYSVWDFRSANDQQMIDKSLVGGCDQRIGSCPANKDDLKVGFYLELNTAGDIAKMIKIR